MLYVGLRWTLYPLNTSTAGTMPSLSLPPMVNTADATGLGDDVEPRLCGCPKFVPWHRGPAEYNLTQPQMSTSRPISRGSGGYPQPPEAKLAFQKSKWFSVVPRGLAGIHWNVEISKLSFSQHLSSQVKIYKKGNVLQVSSYAFAQQNPGCERVI